MERRPDPRLLAGPQPVLLRKHSTVLPVAQAHRIEPGRILLLPSGADYERDAVAGAWQAAGGKVQRLGRFWAPEESLRGKCVCVYGNVIFCQVLAESLGLDLLGPADDLLVLLPEHLLGRTVTLSSLERMSELEYPCFAKSLLPKLFTSGVVTRPEALANLTLGLEPETAILVSEPVRFEGEARAFIYDRRVLDLALYEGYADLGGAMEVAEAVAQLEGTPHGFVVDLGRLKDRWVVVELNPSWGAGLNGCDAEKVILAIAAGTRA
jgi:hypothetical protein